MKEKETGISSTLCAETLSPPCTLELKICLYYLLFL